MEQEQKEKDKEKDKMTTLLPTVAPTASPDADAGNSTNYFVQNYKKLGCFYFYYSVHKCYHNLTFLDISWDQLLLATQQRG